MEQNNIVSISNSVEQIDTTEMDGKYLTFVTDEQLFGVPIADVVQIVGIQSITEIPEFPDYAKGVINLRGSIIPLIDVRLRFGKAERAYDERTCIIVTLIHDISVGFIVDEVDAVTDISDENISAPPRISSDASNSFITGVAKIASSVVLLISASRLLTKEALEELKNVVDDGEIKNA